MSNNRNRGRSSGPLDRSNQLPPQDDPVAAAQASQEAKEAQEAEAAVQAAEAQKEAEAQLAANQAQAEQGVVDNGAADVAADGEIPQPVPASPEVVNYIENAGESEAPAAEAPPVVTRPPSITQRSAVHRQLKVARVESGVPDLNIEHETSAEFDSVMTRERQQGTVNAIGLIAFLDDYVKNMAPKRPTSIDEILKRQEGLLTRIIDLLERAPTNEFNRLWRIAIMYFREYRNHCFSPLYVARGSREWRRSAEEFNLFVTLINMLAATATDREGDFALDKVTAAGLTDEARGRLALFYSA